jgi:hypothetical protein
MGTLMVLVLVGSLGALAVRVALWRVQRPDASAVVVAVVDDDTIQLQVIDGPGGGTFVVDWRNPPEVGDVVAVDLRGTCRCEPAKPGTLLSGAVIVSMMVSGFLAWNVITGVVLVRRGRARAAASAATAFHGPWHPVDLRVVVDSPKARRLELRPTTGDGVPLTASLGRTTRDLDPTSEFVLWGSPVEGGTVSLTSMDGRQLLTVDEPVRPIDASPTADVALTDAVLRALGWPPAAADPAGLEAVDRAADVGVRRYRRFGAVFYPVSVALVLAALVTDQPGWVYAVLAVGCLVIALSAQRWMLAPLAAEVGRRGITDDVALLRRTVLTLWNLRWTPGASGGGRGG